ncbi:uncharacterized protein LOC115980738 [Quercus lobata]|uniref:uncharacterized protein LOC115980738 n=1 Tax=Quercus lobata TaxID=97700 RepID=UPI00124484CA|nr:uncharacterized protein LOC115980738 [Quercus lobata]
MDWLDHFQNIKVQHLMDTTSDHFPILLADAKVLKERRKCRFHFEAIWTRREDCKELIKEVWDGGTNLGSPNGLSTGLKQCAEALSNWSTAAFGQIPNKIQEKKRAISDLIKGDSEGHNGPEINRLRREINNLLDEEEMWWQQRSRVQWLGERDRNTKYFHHRASERRKKNTISGIWSENGAWCESKESIANTVMAYFEGIYTSSHPTRIDEVTNMIPVKVTGEMNAELTRDFTSEEV